MSDILDRTTRLLAALSAVGGRPRSLGEVAEASKIPPATCSRLLKRLAAHGWVDQDCNRGSYRLGPRPYALAAGEPYAAPLLAAALPVLRGLADATGGGCTLSVLRPWRRQLLWECGGTHGVGWQPLREEDDIWQRASGRLLMAALPVAARARWIVHLGLPTPRQWPGIATRAELASELAQLRRQGWAQADDQRLGSRGAAVLVDDGAGNHAALGLFLPRSQWSTGTMQHLRSAAAIVRQTRMVQ